MMKRKNITTIGTINLNDIEFCENALDVFIGIESVSEDNQKKINEAVEIAKAEHLQLIKEYFTNKELKWTDAGVGTFLHIIIDNKEFTYRIEIDIEDEADGIMWTSVSVDVDLSEYQDELKKVIVKVMINNFF